MIAATSEQIDKVESSAHVMVGLSEIGFASFQRLTALSIEAVRVSRDDALGLTSTLVHVKTDQDLKDLKTLPSARGGDALSKFVAYLSGVQGILGDAQTEVNRLMAPYFSTSGKAPAGWSSGFDMMKKMGRETSALVDSNLRKSGEIADSIRDGKPGQAGELAQKHIEDKIRKATELGEKAVSAVTAPLRKPS